MPDTPQSIFISHATPADNEIARWLALRLMREGYLSRVLSQQQPPSPVKTMPPAAKTVVEHYMEDAE